MTPPNPSAAPQTLDKAMSRKKANPLPMILVAIFAVLALGAGVYGYLESRRTERIVVAVADIPYGTQITAEHLGTIEVPLYRPEQIAGINTPASIIGQYASRDMGTNDVVNPSMLMREPPDQPVYPNGAELTPNYVPVPFSTGTIGPITDRDRLNIGFTDPNGDPKLCDDAQAAAMGEPTRLETMQGETYRPYACRFLSDVRVLYVEGGTAYLELSPFQAQAVWAIQAAGLQLWGERYGESSDELPPLTRLDIGQVDEDSLTAPVPTPLPDEDDAAGEGTIPGSEGAIPGEGTIPGEGSTIPGSRP
jgi:hypothetical protein